MSTRKNKHTVTISAEGMEPVTVDGDTFSRLAQSVGELKGEASAVISEACNAFGSLLTSHWKAIRDLADDDDAEGQVKVAFSLALDFNGKTPAGGLDISYARRVKDGATFRVADKEQPELLPK